MFRSILKERKTAKVLLWLCFLVYIAWILKITVFRSDFGTHELFSGEINWSIMHNYALIIGRGYPDIAAFYFFGNIAVFIPFGIFLVVLLDRSFGRCALEGFLVSLAIETAQFVFGVGFSETDLIDQLITGDKGSETDDVILNTAGVILGWCLAAFIQKKAEEKLFPEGRATEEKENS